MKRIITTTAVAAVVAGLTSAPAWAKSCDVGCLNNKLATLNNKVATLTKVVATDTKVLQVYTSCLSEVPVTVYGDGLHNTFGYSYNDGTNAPFLTSALDITQQGGQVDAWLMYDKCNKTTTATTRHGVRERTLTGGLDRAFGLMGMAVATFALDLTPQNKQRP
jgi:hypothetical protein